MNSADSPFRTFDGMCWPAPGERLDELEWRLRYADTDAVVSMADRLCAASVLSAFRELIALPERIRDQRIRELRKGPGRAA